jgi:hypothetical protein
MDRYGDHNTALTVYLHAGLYLANLMDPYVGPHTALTIALHAVLYLENTMGRYRGPRLQLLYHCMDASTYPL